MDLAEMSEDVERETSFIRGAIMSAAFNAPKELNNLKPKPSIDLDKLPGMLRPTT